MLGLSLFLMGCQMVIDPSETFQASHCQADGTFVWVSGGEFIQGSDQMERDYAYQVSAESIAAQPEEIPQREQQLREKQWFDRELDRQAQTLPDFRIGRDLITNRDYQAFVEATGHPAPGISEAEYQRQGFLVHPYRKVEPFLWQGTSYPPGEGNHPVVLVSYQDALAYAQWRGEQEHRTYRLPTEAEWEKAARGTDGAYFPWGNQWQDGATNAAQSGLWHTSEINAFPPSRSVYGVEDMAGNVFEFTSTLTHRTQQGVRYPVAVMKGCSWDDLPGFCRGAYRHTRPIVSRHILFGFRLVRER
jgi:formylglycine-generating enzyme required for sulfatase activity